MMSKFSQNLIAEIKKEIPAKGTLVVGVSGGLDSVALLYLLYAAMPNDYQRLSVVHVHHGLRARDADKDMALVIKHCHQLDIACHVYQSQVSKIAIKLGLSIESAGRLVRQDCFLDTVQRTQAKAVLLAHHQDDQAETVLFRFLRGTSLRGLTGIQSDRIFPHPSAPKNLRLLRPLLSIPKQDLEKFLRQRKIQWREDKTNVKKEFTRNRLRQDLIPHITKTYNPLFKQHLVQMSASLNRDETLLVELTKKAVKKIGFDYTKRPVRIDSLAWKKLPIALQWRVLAWIWDVLKIPQKSQQHLEQVWEVVQGERSATSLPGKWQAKRQKEWLVFFQKKERMQQVAAYKLSLKNGLNQNRKVPFGVKLEMMKSVKKVRQGIHAKQIYVDVKTLKGKLYLRSFQKGDQISPLGMNGKHKSVRKIFSEMKLSSEEIQTWPLVVAGKEVIWIYKGPMADSVKITTETDSCLKISIFLKPE